MRVVGVLELTLYGRCRGDAVSHARLQVSARDRVAIRNGAGCPPRDGSVSGATGRVRPTLRAPLPSIAGACGCDRRRGRGGVSTRNNRKQNRDNKSLFSPLRPFLCLMPPAQAMRVPVSVQPPVFTKKISRQQTRVGDFSLLPFMERDDFADILSGAEVVCKNER